MVWCTDIRSYIYYIIIQSVQSCIVFIGALPPTKRHQLIYNHAVTNKTWLFSRWDGSWKWIRKLHILLLDNIAKQLILSLVYSIQKVMYFKFITGLLLHMDYSHQLNKKRTCQKSRVATSRVLSSKKMYGNFLGCGAWQVHCLSWKICFVILVVMDNLLQVNWFRNHLPVCVVNLV